MPTSKERKVKQESKSPHMPKVEKKAQVEREASPFPRPEPIRNIFCCSEIIETTHKANYVKDYAVQITHFIHFAKQKHDKEAIEVVDLTWPGLTRAEFILQLKRGTFAMERSMETRSKDREKTAPGGDQEGATQWGLGRYFALSSGEAADFVEILINDGQVPDGFENTLGVCKEVVCEEKGHQGVVYQVDVWESHVSLEKSLLRSNRGGL